MKVILATYSAPKTLRLLVICFAIAIAGFAFTTYSPPSPTYGLQLHALVLISNSVFVVFVGVLVYQFVFDGRNAVWMENNKIVHVSEWYRSVNAAEVIGVSAGSFGQFNRPVVVLKLRDGRNINIQADLLVEPGEEIAARLRESLVVAHF